MAGVSSLAGLAALDIQRGPLAFLRGATLRAPVRVILLTVALL